MFLSTPLGKINPSAGWELAGWKQFCEGLGEGIQHKSHKPQISAVSGVQPTGAVWLLQSSVQCWSSYQPAWLWFWAPEIWRDNWEADLLLSGVLGWLGAPTLHGWRIEVEGLEHAYSCKEAGRNLMAASDWRWIQILERQTLIVMLLADRQRKWPCIRAGEVQTGWKV